MDFMGKKQQKGALSAQRLRGGKKEVTQDLAGEETTKKPGKAPVSDQPSCGPSTESY